MRRVHGHPAERACRVRLVLERQRCAPKRRVNFWNAGASLGGPVPSASQSPLLLRERRTATHRASVDDDVSGARAEPARHRDAGRAPAARRLPAAQRPRGGANGLAELTREFPVESKLSAFSLRVDGNLTDRHRLFTRINRGTLRRRRARHDYADAARLVQSQGSGRDEHGDRRHHVGVLLRHARSARQRQHARGSLTASPAGYGDAGALPLDLLVPPEARNDAWVRVQVVSGPGGFAIEGRGAGGRQQQFQVADTWTWLKGRHEWRFGVDFRRVTTSTDAAEYRYNYRFFSHADFQQGRVRSVTIERALPSRTRRDTTAIFAQDTFRLTPRLSFNYGLRYSVRPAPASANDTHPLLLDFAALPEIQTLPEGSRLWKTSWTDLAPQVTATYQLSNAAGRETSLRAGWSLAFDEVTSPGANAFGAGAPYVSRRTLLDQTFPLTAEALAAPPPDPFSDADQADYYAFDGGLRSPRTHQWQVTLDQALGSVQRIGLAYVGTAARDLPYWHAYAIAPGGPLRINAFSDDGRSDYHAMLAQYVRRLSRGFQASLSYTWSHAIDLDSGDTLLPLPPPSLVAPSSNRGSADFDRRHVLYATASYRVPGHRAPEWLRPLASDWQIDVAAMCVRERR